MANLIARVTGTYAIVKVIKSAPMTFKKENQ